MAIDYEARLTADKFSHPHFRHKDGRISLADISDRYRPKCVHGNYLVSGITFNAIVAVCGCTMVHNRRGSC